MDEFIRREYPMRIRMQRENNSEILIKDLDCEKNLLENEKVSNIDGQPVFVEHL